MGDDRRSQERAEIVGQLWGSLGVVHHIRDICREGALLEAAHSLAPLSVQRMRLALDELEGSAEVRVRRVAPVAAPGERERYLVGLEFVELPAAMRERIEQIVEEADAGRAPRQEAEAFDERRRARRVSVAGRRCEMTIWSPVRVVDISLSGALLASSRPIGAAERAELRAAFDSDPFSSGVEIRRVVAGHEGESGSVRLGVRFVEPDDESRRALGQFLRRAIV
jgi:c-di-GMP-binding flagellar brake protein YcgR